MAIHSNTLVQSFGRHVFAPVGLGGRATKLHQKFAALAHSLWIEVSNPLAFNNYVSTVVSFTGDLGTESGFADAPKIALYNLLPSLSESAMHIENDFEGGGQLGGDADSQQYTFNQAIFVAGLQHILGNLTQEMCEALPEFEHWYSRVQPLTTLLHRRDRLEIG